MGAKLEEELSVGTVHLVREGARDWAPGLQKEQTLEEDWVRACIPRTKALQICSCSPDLLPRLHIHAYCLLDTLGDIH